jgi:hypothetical protein
MQNMYRIPCTSFHELPSHEQHMLVTKARKRREYEPPKPQRKSSTTKRATSKKQQNRMQEKMAKLLHSMPEEKRAIFLQELRDKGII